jgi:hypothetical protein
MKISNISSLFIALVMAFVIPTASFAKTDVILGSASTVVTAGQQFSVTITVTPTTETIYTSKIVASYSSDIVDVSSFSFAPSWLALSQPGYDSVDASTGTLIKTAGFPSGIVSGSSKLFGTITFKAKKSGTLRTRTFSQVQQTLFRFLLKPLLQLLHLLQQLQRCRLNLPLLFLHQPLLQLHQYLTQHQQPSLMTKL